MALKAWYIEILKYTTKPDITIIIDNDTLNAPAVAGKRFLYNPDKNEIVIDVSNLSPQEETAIIDILIQNQNEGIDILFSEQDDTIDNYEGYSDSFNPYKETIELLTPHIPLKDILALKMAYFMRIKNEQGEDIREYRKSIRERFGLRGLYIANLCTSGYFENQFRKKVLQLDNAKFKEYYELRVGSELAALFVHNGMTTRSLEQLLGEKLSQCALNDIFKFRVYALGGANVALVKEVARPELLLEVGIPGKITIRSESLHHHPVNIDVEIEII